MTDKTSQTPQQLADIAEAIEQVRLHGYSNLRLNDLNLTEIPEEVFTLDSLEFIDFSKNNLRTIPERLWDLPKLREVSLLGNPIETLPRRARATIDLSTYRQCCSLLEPQNINLVIDGSISEGDVDWLLSEFDTVKGPSGMLIFNINVTHGEFHTMPAVLIQRILASLPKFDFVETLGLIGIPLDGVPVGIRHLPGLKNLGLSYLGLTTIPDWISELNLESFVAEGNNLSSMPDSLGNLKGLKRLTLKLTLLPKIPQFVFDLPALEFLSISETPISEIPPEILQLPQLQVLDFDSEKIQSPPPEVAVKGLEAIRNYWRQRAEGVDYLCEAKLIILGEPGAGKTSLAKKIENPNYVLIADEKSTEGIDVIRYRFPTMIHPRDNDAESVPVKRDFQINIWDFGGQEIYHATHQFFLTKRSVYVLVCDDRQEDTNFSYWLQVVEMLSDGSPLLIVQNEKQDRTRDINLSGLRAQFANLRGAISTNLATNRRLDNVIKSIQKELASLPHVGTGLPATWRRVREALEQDQRDYISLGEFLNICQQHGFTKPEDKLQLSGFLHDLGICLHFQDDKVLKNTVILKPSWGTDAVYRVLDDAEVQAAHGRFTHSELGRIWSEEKYAGMQDELLHLMMKFQLCYALDEDKAFIAPELLSSEQPSYAWEPTGGLIVRYEYSFLPKGIITRFVVGVHRLIAGEKLVWKTGVVLERDGSRAEVIEEYSKRRIRVRVSGPAQRELLAIIDDQLERLHASFPRLQYERYLPCSCIECQAKAEPYGFALDALIKMAKKDQAIQCHESGEMVDATKLVREILPGALPIAIDVEHFLPKLTLKTAPPLTSPQPALEVFVSYGWTPESKTIVDRIQEALSSTGIRLLRDSEEVRYKDSIRDFMRRIGQGKCVVVVISEKYLKSENCMFEMIEISKNPGLRERIFPIVLSDANIYKATGRIKYVSYWEDEIKELDTALKTVRGDNLSKLQEDLNLYSEIRRLFDGITDTLRDMNALTPDQHEGSGFEELIRRIRAQLSVC